MNDYTEVIDAANAIFDAVDAKKWDAAQAFFETSVRVDYASLKCGRPETISSSRRSPAVGRRPCRRQAIQLSSILMVASVPHKPTGYGNQVVG